MKQFTICAAIVLVAACSSSAQQAKRPAHNDVVATVGTTSITLDEVDDKALEAPTSNFTGKLSQALYEARRAALEEIVASRLMDAAAKAQGIERTALVEKEITSKVASVTDAEIESWYRANQNRVQGAPLEQVRQPIRAYLTQERMQAVRQDYIDTLKARTPVKVMLEPPRLMAKVPSSSPVRGPAGAPVEIIEWSDFQ